MCEGETLVSGVRGLRIWLVNYRTLAEHLPAAFPDDDWTGIVMNISGEMAIDAAVDAVAASIPGLSLIHSLSQKVLELRQEGRVFDESVRRLQLVISLVELARGLPPLEQQHDLLWDSHAEQVRHGLDRINETLHTIEGVLDQTEATADSD
jgi:hypothetical protein